MEFVRGFAGSAAFFTLLGLLGLLFRKGALDWVGGAVKQRFDRDLEAFKAELQGQRDALEAERKARAADTEALRKGALDSAAAHQTELSKRRIQAVDTIWRATFDLTAFKMIVTTARALNIDGLAVEIANGEIPREQVEQFTKILFGNLNDPSKVPMTSDADKVRPFIPELTWALFSAYRTIMYYPYLQFYLLKSGVKFDFPEASGRMVELAVQALPKHEKYVREHGYQGVLNLTEELEQAVLQSLRDALAFKDGDHEGVQRATEINKAIEAIEAARTAQKAPSPDFAKLVAEMG